LGTSRIDKRLKFISIRERQSYYQKVTEKAIGLEIHEIVSGKLLAHDLKLTEQTS